MSYFGADFEAPYVEYGDDDIDYSDCNNDNDIEVEEDEIIESKLTGK